MTVTPSSDIWEDVCPLEERRLSEEHRRILTDESFISPDIIDSRGYYSLSYAQVVELANLEVIAASALKATGWMAIPIFRPDGIKHGEIIRLFGVQASYKYLWPSGMRLAFDVHPSSIRHLFDPTVDLIITEGIKKADALLSAARREGYPLVVVSLNGCEGWRVKLDGNRVASPDFIDIAWENRRVFVVSDSDYRTNDDVARGWSGCALYTSGKTGSHKTFLVVVPPLGLEKQGADDYLARGHSLEDLLSHAQTPRHATIEQDQDRVPLKLKTGTQLMREAGDRIPYLIEPLVPEQSIMLLAGHSGTYKTWAALSLALDGAFGLPWLDHTSFRKPTRPWTTLFINKEMSGIILGQRLKILALNKRYNLVPDWERIIEERIIFVDEAALDLNVEAQRARLEDAIVATEARLVVIDSLSMAWHGEENSSTEVGAFYTQLRAITERTKTAWVLIHHLLKPSSGKLQKGDPITAAIRGSGQLTQQADVAVMLAHYATEGEQADRLIAMTHAKARTDQEVPAWVSRFSINDGFFGSFGYLCSLADAKARDYARSPESPEKLRAWMLEEIRTMPGMDATSSGLRFKHLLGLLQANWTVEDTSPPSESNLRRQLDTLVSTGILDLLHKDRRLGDLYRLKEPDDEPTPPAAPAADPETGTADPDSEPTPPGRPA